MSADLTQAEIDALLRGEELPIHDDSKDTGEVDISQYEGAEGEVSSSPAVIDSMDFDEETEDIYQFLDPVEVDALGEIGNICMGNSATTMSNVLGHRVVITTPTVKLFKSKNVLAAYHCPFLVVSVGYVEGIIGKNLLILKNKDAAIITDLMMGGSGEVDEDNIVIDELQLSAISEIMNQMIGASATAMSNMLGIVVNISPPAAENIEADEGVTKFLDGSDLVIRISFDMEIEGILKSKLIQMMSLDLAKKLLATQLGGGVSEPEPAPAPAPAPKPAPAPAPRPAPAPAPRPAAPKVEVTPAACVSFDEPGAYEEDSVVGNLDLISDIPLEVTVEIGKTKRSLNDVMNLTANSIIMLDRLAGEPVDIIVNGKPVARGEVVVIEENYGVRITEMLTSSEMTAFRNLSK